ncbi:MAG: PfkB family carbohydrate kinase [Acidobacteria bacterium]|nr:PfkB family carbohydrate kinase [Acidobacteriota bacterium]
MTTKELLDAFHKLKALVIGDICVDRWCTYDPATSEPSRETSIPRLGVVSTEVTPGAGGTVANNLASVGTGKVAVLGVRGDDGFGFELDRALAERGITSELMVKVPDWQTFTYTKLLNSQTGVEDQPRVDFISTRPLPTEAEQRVIENIHSAVGAFDVVLVADQAETRAGGVVTPSVRNAIIEAAQKYSEKVFLADSRKRAHLFRNMTLKPNLEEAEDASRALLGTVDFRGLRRELGAKVLVVTHGSKGALVMEENKETWAEARPVENPVDICGAGDSFAAGYALSMAVNGDPVAAARFGNLIASITIMKKGTGTASPQEILASAGLHASS